MTTENKSTFNVTLDEQGILQIGFGVPADNDQIVKDCKKACDDLVDKVRGKVLRVNGRASIQAAGVVAHSFAHVVPAIAFFDPKLGKFIVSVTHSPDFELGAKID